jgi:hypothetical protein
MNFCCFLEKFFCKNKLCHTETQWAIEPDIKISSMQLFHHHTRQIAIKKSLPNYIDVKLNVRIMLQRHVIIPRDHKLIDNFSLTSIVCAEHYIELKSIKQIKWIKKNIEQEENLDWSRFRDN